MRALAAYPLDCLEQLTSRGLPLAMLTGGTVAGADRAGSLETATEAVLDRQRYDGAFGLWSSTGDAQPWLNRLCDRFPAARAGCGRRRALPSAISQALGWLTQEVATPPQSPRDTAAQAYALYVLALAGQPPAGAIRVAADAIGQEPTPLARAQIAAALARLGEAAEARGLFTDVLAEAGATGLVGRLRLGAAGPVRNRRAGAGEPACCPAACRRSARRYRAAT